MQALWSRCRFNARWSAALLVAALFSIWSRHGWVRIGKAFGLWFGLFHGKAFVSKEIAAFRLETCRKCPVFYAPLETCGSPLRKESRGLGCYCFQPVKVRLCDATCWLDDNIEPGYSGGWQHAIASARSGP